MDDDSKQTPLQLAAAEGQKECVVALLAQGAQASSQTPAGWTALHYAAREGHCEVRASA